MYKTNQYGLYLIPFKQWIISNIDEIVSSGQGMLFYQIVVVYERDHICVKTFDVATYFEGPILRVDVATDSTGLLDQVDEACGTISRCGN